jgi:hypothetical protein
MIKCVEAKRKILRNVYTTHVFGSTTWENVKKMISVQRIQKDLTDREYLQKVSSSNTLK